MEEKNEFAPIEDYLTPKLKVYYDSILSKGHEVMILRKHGYHGSWKIRENVPYHIVMPWDDVGNKALFAHELLHIYLDFVKGMFIPIMTQISMTSPYHSPKGEFLNQHVLNSIINTLQHHKMLPLYLECGFETDKFVGNYYEFIDTEKAINDLINIELSNHLSPFQKYATALHVADYICLEKYNVNTEHKNLLQKLYSHQIQAKYSLLYQKLNPIIEAWDSDDNLVGLINRINDVAKEYSQEDNII